MNTSPILAASVAAALVAAFVPQGKPRFGLDARTPIDAIHTPGDANSRYRITQSGSYYLTKPLKGKPGKRGVEIAVSDVTIDLNGFALVGVADALDGIAVDVACQRIRIQNGSVSAWGGDGLDLSLAEQVWIEDVISSSNGSYGMRLGALASVSGCGASSNGGRGISAEDDAMFVDCIANDNGHDGMYIAYGGVVDRSLSRGNGQDGMNLGYGGKVHRSVGRDNERGINASAGVHESVGLQNEKEGIWSAFGVIEGCTAASNGEIGIKGSGVVRGNAAKGNTVGIRGQGDGALLIENVAHQGQTGIQTSGRMLAAGNLVSLNTTGLRGYGDAAVHSNLGFQNVVDFWYESSSVLRGPKQDIDDGAAMSDHHGVNISD